MKDLWGKFTFQFLIGQLLPGALLAMAAALFFCEEMPPAEVAGFPESMLWLCCALIDRLSSVALLLLFSGLAVILGMLLHGISCLVETNRQSFRKFRLNNKNCWVRIKKKNQRKRLWIRRKISVLWTRKKFWLIFLLSPLLFLFDILSVFAARMQNLYGEILFARAADGMTDSVKLVIEGYEYLAEFFGNIALALLFALPFLIPVTLRLAGWREVLAVVGIAYILIALTYLLDRVVREEIDRAIEQTFRRNPCVEQPPDIQLVFQSRIRGISAHSAGGPQKLRIGNARRTRS